MDINPSEVAEIKEIGNLFGHSVKLVKTHGGFNVAVGKKKKSSNKTEALAAGSHQALVAHHLSKEYGADFQPAMFKSEEEALEKVEEQTTLLPSEAIKKGIELFTLNKNFNYEFVLYKHGLCLARYEAEKNGDQLVLKKYNFSVEPDKEIAKSMARAIEHTALELNVKEIVKGWL